MESKRVNHSTLTHTSLLSTYLLVEGVQVRQEKFGLLFYNYRGPRLYFVPSQGLIPDDFFDGKMAVGDLANSVHAERGWPRQWVYGRIEQILTMLEAKGLIHGQSIC